MNTSGFKNMLMGSLVWLVAGLVAGPSAAQSADDQDVAVGIAMPMVVDRVEAESGTLYLNGQAYVYRESDEALSAAGSPTGTRPVSLRELRSGMEVIVMTDGTAPDRNHKPLIRGMWLAP